MALAYGQEILRFSAINKFSFFVHTVNFIRIALLMILDDLFSFIFVQFFRTKPYACDPSSLPKYAPNKEMDAKLREDALR
jgi:hypothetical protein